MKRAIVFGATGTIGQAICHKLAADGWSLYIHANHHFELASNLAEKLQAEYPMQDMMPISLDFLSDDEKLSQFVDNLLAVNAVVFSQGITKYGLLRDQELANIDDLIKVNLTTPIKLSKLFEPKLLKNDFSRIVYIGSVYGGQGSAMETVYSATKAALANFSASYAKEVAAMKLTVNVIAPGAVDSAMNQMISQQEMNDVIDEIPAGRLATGDDVAIWVSHLLAPDSNYLTGQTIYVSGGWLR
ncbi:MAG: SDR family NAD(P)-dependent oxidoreductase [Lactobacillus sp.]|nr:SDR family NAD(P)-dependent oxidoreductase [Lactobacillus sp.]